VQGIKVGIDTAFPVGSVTKLVTAAVVMTEVDAGRLDLDAPITPLVSPELRPVDATGAEIEVSLRQLLSHSSGLPVTWDGFPPNPPVESRAAYIGASRTIVHPPGERLVYSNVAFVLAGEIAAASAGLSFEQLAQDRLFAPLGMKRTSLGNAADFEYLLAAGHRRGTDDRVQPEPHLDLTPMAAAGSLLTTPDDLARFAMMLRPSGPWPRPTRTMAPVLSGTNDDSDPLR
jgi:CubicO group peptidase (beta-lactamase class C family)